MTLYLTPAEDMKTYLDEMKYKDQRVTQKMIGVDTAKYMLEIDGRSDEIHTGGEGCWGNEVELYRRVGKQRVSDAMIISVAMREETDFERMRQMARFFFPELQQVDRGVKKKKRGDTAR